MGSSLQENDTKINPNLQEAIASVKPNEQQAEEPRDEISKSVSEASKSPLTPLSESQQYNIHSNEEKALNRPNFVTLGKILEEEQIEIIKTGFQLQAKGKLSLKKYYESTDPNSLFQSKGYSIKYETIRKITLFKKFKFYYEIYYEKIHF